MLRRFGALAFSGGVTLCFGLTAQAQISVGLLGSTTNSFNATPPLAVTEWATSTLGVGGFGSGTFTTPTDIDTAAQTVDQLSITQALGTTTANATSAGARHNVNSGYVITQPAAVSATVLKATLRNTSGITLDTLIVSYDFGVAAPGPFEGAPGHRVFFSTTGLSNSWQFIPELSGLTNAESVSATIFMGAWAYNTDLFLLWLDDNATTNPDGIYTIDNFSVRNGHVDPTPIVITNSPASLTVGEHDLAVFNVTAGGAVQTFYWFSNNVPVPGNDQANFTITSAAYPANDGTQIYVIVSNALGAVTSTVATLTVLQDTAPPLVVETLGLVNLTTVSVNFSEALRPDTVVVENFYLYPTGDDPETDSLLTFSALLNNGTNVVLTTEARTQGMNYSLRILDVLDNSSAQNLISPNPAVIPNIRQQVLLVDFDVDNIWQYSLETNLFGTGWETTGYDDRTWPSGPAGLGVDSSMNGVPIRTSTAYSGRSEPQFFRRHFTLPALTNGLTLTLRDVVEDGAVYFINGQEVFRHNVPAGALTSATRAAASQTDPTPIQGPFNLPITNVVPGDNVMAVVVVQSGSLSSDMELAVELMAEISRYPTGPVVITAQPTPYTSIIEGQNLTLSVAVDGALPIIYQWRKDGDAIPGQTNASFTIEGAVPSDSGFYVVVVSNSYGSVTSRVAQVTAGDYPVPLHAAYNPVSGQITITWTLGVLQEATHLLNTNTSWADVSNNPASSYAFTPAPGTQRFFRLRP